MYLLYRNYGTIGFKMVENQTRTAYILAGWSYPRLISKINDEHFIAVVETREQAVHMQQVLSGIEGEYTRRQQAADKECQARYLAAREARDAAVKRALAGEI